jgi:hypothetical protein
MRVFSNIAMNGFMELIRQPIYLVLMVSSNVFMLILASLYYVGAGEDSSMVQGGVLATVFLTGLFTAVLGAALSVGEEIESGTALAVLSKPVGRITFVLAKFTALASALAVQCYTGCLAALLASRMAFDVYGSPDYPAFAIYGAGIALACIIGLCNQLFYHETLRGTHRYFHVVLFNDSLRWSELRGSGLASSIFWGACGLENDSSSHAIIARTMLIGRHRHCMQHPTFTHPYPRLLPGSISAWTCIRSFSGDTR